MNHSYQKRVMLFLLIGAMSLCMGLFLQKPGDPPKAEAQSRSPIKIGYIQTLSGLPMVYTGGALHAFQMGIDEINAAGGVLERPIQIVVRDDKGIPSEGLKLARELVLNEEVDILAGSMISSVALAISEFAKSQKILFVVDGATSSAITGEKGHEYVIRVGNNTAIERGQSLVSVLKNSPYKRFFTITPDYEYGWRIISDFWDNFIKVRKDVERVGEIKLRFGTPDFKPAINAIIEAKPEVVISGLWGSDSVTFIQQAKASGLFEKIKLYAGSEVLTVDVARALGRECPEGILSGTLYPFWELGKKIPRSLEFNRKYYDLSGKFPLSGDALGYEHIYWITEGIKKAGSLGSLEVSKALRGMIRDTLTGPVKLRDRDGQVLLPYFWGYSKFVNEYPFAILADLRSFTPEEPLRPVEEVQAKPKPKGPKGPGK